MAEATIDGVVPRTRMFSAHHDFPDWWNPCGIVNGHWTNLAPDDAPIMQPDAPGGRSMAVMVTPWADVEVTVTWPGVHADGAGGPIIHAEGTEFHGGLSFCYEPDLFAGLWVLWGIGLQPDEVVLLAASGSPAHVDGTPVVLGISLAGETVTCTVDGAPVIVEEFPHDDAGPMHYHGVVVDVNAVPGRPANLPVLVDDLTITPIR